MSDLGVQRRLDALLVAALLATCIGAPLLVLSVLLHVVGEVVVHAHPEWLPANATYIPPSNAERVRTILRFAVPLVGGVGFLVLTWKFRDRGRRVATAVCAIVTVLLAAASLW
jgi:hypothetical protein